MNLPKKLLIEHKTRIIDIRKFYLKLKFQF